MKKIVRLTESDLVRIVKRVLMENVPQNPEIPVELMECLTESVGELPEACMSIINTILIEKKIPPLGDDRLIPCIMSVGTTAGEKLEIAFDCIQDYMTPKTGEESGLANK
jgi:hypothetical protein